MSQLAIWRIQAFIRLEELISTLQGNISPKDERIDALIRVLSNKPARPGDRPPYAGIFATTDAAIGRKKSMERLSALLDTLQGDLSPTDGLIDDLLRLLINQPPRPADKQPYASLFPPSNFHWIRAEELRQITPAADRTRLIQLIPHLNRAMLEYKITTPLRQAHFLAQLAHESDRFNALEEYASGADYEWRDDLGNVYQGDGVHFKGRGLIQITGRNNYRRCGQALGVDLINHPKRLSDPDLACRSAGWYWDDKKLNLLCDRDDVEEITLIINGGLNGLDDRRMLLTAAKRILLQ